MTKSAVEFDEKRWEKVIQRPDWYLEFNDFAQKARLKAEPESKPQKRLNKQVRRFFEAALRDGTSTFLASRPARKEAGRSGQAIFTKISRFFGDITG
jgi:hypothetical protein